MSAEEPGSHRLQVEESSGLKARIDIENGALIARDLEVELMDMVFKAANPAKLLCMTVASFFLALADEFRKLLNEVSNLCHACIGERGVDHADDSGGKGVRVMVGPRRSIQQELLGGRGSFSRLRCSLRRVDDFFSGGIEFGVSGVISGQGVSTTRD